jgi:membrane protein implicated in regulation of membrane protease activity
MMIDGVAIASPYLWLIAGVVLAIAELMVPGFFLIWVGGAAILTGFCSAVLALPREAEFILFAVAAVASVLFGRKWLKGHNVGTNDPLLNNRAARLVGRSVIVIEPIAGGEGRVKVDDGVWNASGPDAPAGIRVKVIGFEGARLIVEAEDL